MSSFQETPIVLVHGFLGYDELDLPGLSISYFRGIPDALRGAGYSVPEPPKLNSGGSVKERASDLREYLESNDEVAGRKVHLIGYSMGGLDCRYLVSCMGMAERVMSLTTLGAPHRGTALADVAVEVLGSLVKAIDATRLLDLRGSFDLTVRNCKEFNREDVPDTDHVRYYSVAGLYHPESTDGPDLLGLSHKYLMEREGDNDGLVSVRSATYGTFLGTWPGNHFRLVNCPTNLIEPAEELDDPSVIQRYLDLVARLARDMP